MGEWDDLDADLADSLSDDLLDLGKGLEGDRPSPGFVLSENQFHARRAKKELLKAGRRGIKAKIRPENAKGVLPHLPEGPDDRTHAILRGDFVLCDLIPAILDERGACGEIHIATLGLSRANAETLARLQREGMTDRVTVLCSSYFQQVDKLTTFRDVEAILAKAGRLIVARNHAKVICLPTARGAFVIEGSANLRSSDNLEQIAIFNDPELLQWHVRWIEGLKKQHG